MAGNGTTIANLLSDPAAEQAISLAEDTLEGASSEDSFAPAAAISAAENLLIWNAAAAAQAGAGGDETPEPASVSEPAAPAPAGDPLPPAAVGDPHPAAPVGDPGPGPATLMPAVGGASLVAGDSHGAGMVRIAIGDWNDPAWSGSLPWWGEGGLVKERDIAGDGFGEAEPGEYVHGGYDYGYDYGYYGDGSYAGDGDYNGDGAYDYAGYYGYSLSSVGDINGDGFEDWLYEGYGYSYTMYGYDGDWYSYAGDGFDGSGDGGYDYSYDYGGYYSYAVGDVNGDGFEDYVVGSYGYAYTRYGYADASHEGDGGGPVPPSVPHGHVVLYADGASRDISIQVYGNAVVKSGEDGELFVSAGDGYAVISIGDDVMSFGDASAVLNSVSGVRLATLGIIGEMHTFIADT